MENRQQHFKAFISNSGDESVYQALSGEVQRRLPTASVSWKRSFGRPSKEVALQANFVKFDASQFKRNIDSATTLTTQPLLHIFWTSCLDNDKYKSGIRNQIIRWQKILSENRNTDWLIVHVVYQDNTKPNKSKLNLPRSSVYDKIKTEFAQKNERCIQLWEPDKETLSTKSGESWDAFLVHMRNLLLESFGQHLDSFEDRIRVMREKYADPEWPFIEYFVVHEELALIYQSITLREDALVQYDEVDALLSQFIINCSGRELPKWLKQFSVTPTNWDGVSLSIQNMESYRTLIKSGNASLIDFRNYLFSRQCKLLITMIRKPAIPPRLMEFVYMVVQELKLLNVGVQDGCVACWTVLTCMQLFQVLENVEDKDYEFRSMFAHMHDYMRQKFHYLGQLTGLYYNREQTEEEKRISTMLVAGFGKYPSRKNEMPSAIKLLNAALSSKDAYESLYLDLSNKTIHLMTSLRRLHFGMYVGIDLAKFHLQYGRYDEAEPLLEKAWSIYKQQKWESLYTDVLIPLADCQLKHTLNNRYLNSVMMLSCAKCLPLKTKNHYSNELLKLSNNDSLDLPVTSMDPVIKIVDIKIHLIKNKGHIGDMVQVTVELCNELTIELPCRSLYIILKHSDLSNPRSFADDLPVSRTPSKFDNVDSTVSLYSEEKPKEIPKDPLTPSSFLKKIKGHKRTWSRNKNILENNSSSQNSSQNSSPSDSRSSSVSYGITSTTDGGSVARKALFTDKEAKSVSNGDLKFYQDHFTRSGSLQDINIKSITNELKSSSIERNELRSSCIELRSSYMDDPSNDPKSTDSDEKASVVFKSNSLHQKSNSVEDMSSLGTQVKSLSFENSQTLTSEKEGEVIAPPPSSNGVVYNESTFGKPLATSSVTESVNGCTNKSSSTNEASTSKSSSVGNDDIFLEPELEENLDQTLATTENFILKPGHNSLELKSKINIEGKFVLQSMNCVMGKLKFFKLLTQLSRNTKSFFMVADPPKIVWTTDHLIDYLLTGSKQRLHVTLLNGPGVILQGSIINILSLSGLQFEDLSSSQIQIYPLERDGPPREETISATTIQGDTSSIMLYLPACKPYERVNIHFDVTAPVHSDTGDNRMTQHQIGFNCSWLKDLVDSTEKLDCIFYEPFKMDYETLQKGSSVFVKVILRGVNPVSLLFFSPKLSILSNDKLSLHLLSESSLSVYAMEECNLLWKLDCSELTQPCGPYNKLQCRFEVNFKPFDGSDIGCFCKPININYTRCLFTVGVSMPTCCLKKSEPCSVTVTIRKMFLGNLSYRLFLILNTEKQTWYYSDEGSPKHHEVVFDDESNEMSIVIDISSELDGNIPAPIFLLAKLNNDGNVILRDVFDGITSFGYGEVDYKHTGQIIFYNEDDEESRL